MVAVLRRVGAGLVDGLDATLIIATMLLAALGLATLYSASHDAPARLTGQLVNFSVAFVAMWIAARIQPETLMRVALPAYAIGLALLVAVALHGETVNGAKRWLHVGVTRFQPSEMMKLALPLMLAWYFARNEGALRLRDFAIGAVLVAVPVLLIARQPDLGTAALVAAAGAYILYFAGIGWRVIATLAVLGGASLVPLWGLLHDYQRKRVLTLLDPSQDPLGAGYHTIQSTIAVGSGGVFGKGWLQGTQAHLEFIPERHTDFIFAVYSEEFGLMGNCLLLALYMLLIARGLIITAQAVSLFSRLLAGAVTLMFFTYAFVNMGMVSGILPVVGVPLPFISYGGTALVTLFIGIGILMSLRRQRRLVPA
ncbi:MAG TPA: rod shape-determining protein RodA [Burkholderiales bacterium]|jgi:rod shape determining protein RodA|nr:rod shape-determining protein RodA [Burkholderiales bacterium]